MRDKLIDFFSGKSVLILGFGLEGKSTYRILTELNCAGNIMVADRNPIIEDLDCRVFIGENYLKNIKNYDIIMKSPGIALLDSLPESEKAKITSQTDLLLRFCKSKTVGVTGTKGKSTTASLIYHILKNCGKKSALTGNIGIPPLDDYELYDDDTIVVCELSSHQLEYVKASPDIAVILNIFPEHLDHYVSFKAYKSAKENIFKFQNQDGIVIYDEELVSDSYISIIDKKIPISDVKTKLIGRNNLNNIAVSLKVSVFLGCFLDEAVKAVESFVPLKHRLEPIGNINGVEYINDSISTIPQAAINALISLPGSDTLIVGGMDRGISYDILIDFLKDGSVLNLIVLPGAGYRIADEIEAAYTPKFSIYRAQDLENAVRFAKSVTKLRCILSPAAASYDFYKNFEERGEHFRTLVNSV
ncbi:MAG: UDP-N-acetylmuramoyl-L-alanine--D-glutamate ligase [Eubacterium sp.]|jgi:UDP-N-acetylmuramoylalanine--D-glutamate ligase|nr:UDP-N-acetylmuramoyl-L-alanine--D-glutamate ligase [Eubacterium sp.]